MTRRVHRRQVALFEANDPSVLLHAAERLGAPPASSATKMSLAARIADEFNAHHRLGEFVVYTPPDTSWTSQARLLVPARVLPSGDVVVELDGVRGTVPIQRVVR